MKNNKVATDGFREIVFYKTDNGDVRVEILIQNENLWLTQAKIAELFDVDRSVVTKHISNIFKEGELEKEAVCAIIAHTASDGKNYNTMFYNLDMIIAVGYRVNSKKATHFRIWATNVLKEYIIKGFAMDDERLKNPQHIFGKDYFDEQLARIRDIRSSERRMYQKITDIYAQCSADYAVNSNISQEFYATVQNKLHYAVTGETAAELVYHRVDSTKENMGLTNWKNAPEGRIRKDDVSIAKNYLNEEELGILNRIVTMYLDYAELQAAEHKVMYMEDWKERLDAFLQFNRKDILEDSGKVSAEVAKATAECEYEKFKVVQDGLYQSDFDRMINYIEKKSTDRLSKGL